MDAQFYFYENFEVIEGISGLNKNPPPPPPPLSFLLALIFVLYEAYALINVNLAIGGCFISQMQSI